MAKSSKKRKNGTVKKNKTKFQSGTNFMSGVTLGWSMIWPLMDDEWPDIDHSMSHTEPGSREVVKVKEIKETIMGVLHSLKFTYGVVVNVHCKYEDGSKDTRIARTVFRGMFDDIKSNTDDLIRKVYAKCNMKYYTHTTFEVFAFKDHNLDKVNKLIDEHFEVVAA